MHKLSYTVAQGMTSSRVFSDLHTEFRPPTITKWNTYNIYSRGTPKLLRELYGNSAIEVQSVLVLRLANWHPSAILGWDKANFGHGCWGGERNIPFCWPNISWKCYKSKQNKLTLKCISLHIQHRPKVLLEFILVTLDLYRLEVTIIKDIMSTSVPWHNLTASCSPKTNTQKKIKYLKGLNLFGKWYTQSCYTYQYSAADSGLDCSYSWIVQNNLAWQF